MHFSGDRESTLRSLAKLIFINESYECSVYFLSTYSQRSIFTVCGRIAQKRVRSKEVRNKVFLKTSFNSVMLMLLHARRHRYVLYCGRR